MKKAIEEEEKSGLQYKLYHKKAQENGKQKVANTFFGLRESTQKSVRNLKRALKREGLEPQEVTEQEKAAKTAITKNNIERALHKAEVLYAKTYRELLKGIEDQLNEENYTKDDDAAIYALNWARMVQKTHVQVLSLVSKSLEKQGAFQSQKVDEDNVFVCEVCGNLIYGVPERLCPVCDNPPDFYKVVVEQGKEILEEGQKR